MPLSYSKGTKVQKNAKNEKGIMIFIVILPTILETELAVLDVKMPIILRGPIFYLKHFQNTKSFKQKIQKDYLVLP